MQVNDSYNINIDGTTNMTTIFNANSFAAKGRYFEMSTEAESSQPRIRGADGAIIQANEDSDNSYVGVEKYTGVTLMMMERFFYNMVIYQDELFPEFNPTIPENGFFFPLVFVDRNLKWS